MWVTNRYLTGEPTGGLLGGTGTLTRRASIKVPDTGDTGSGNFSKAIFGRLTETPDYRIILHLSGLLGKIASSTVRIEFPWDTPNAFIRPPLLLLTLHTLHYQKEKLMRQKATVLWDKKTGRQLSPARRTKEPYTAQG
jgi:hypothetical protein